MTPEEFLLKSIDLAFETGRGNKDAFAETFGTAYSRGIRRELAEADADVQHAVTGLPERNGRQVRARCGTWVDEKHNSHGPVTCVHCNRLTAEDEAEEAAMLKLFMGDRA